YDGLSDHVPDPEDGAPKKKQKSAVGRNRYLMGKETLPKARSASKIWALPRAGLCPRVEYVRRNPASMHGWRSITSSFIVPLAALLLLAGTARVEKADLPAVTIEEIVQQMEAKFSTITEIEVTVEVEQYNATDGSVTPGRGRLLAVLPDLFRFEWLEPDMLAGSILLVDRAKNEARQYNPVREEHTSELQSRENLVCRL